MTRMALAAVVVFCGVAPLGCGLGEQAAPSSVAQTEAALTLGSRGPEVVKLHDYLTRFGYFPNAGLVNRLSGLAPDR